MRPGSVASLPVSTASTGLLCLSVGACVHRGKSVTKVSVWLLPCTLHIQCMTYVKQPLEFVHMDYLSLEPSKGNIENVLVITDHFTRYALAYLGKTQTAQATARILWDNFICHYGFPEKFISDQGTNFESDLIKELCKIAGVKKIDTTPYYPKGNGQCERFNSTLCNMLGTLSDEE